MAVGVTFCQGTHCILVFVGRLKITMFKSLFFNLNFT